LVSITYTHFDFRVGIKDPNKMQQMTAELHEILRNNHKANAIKSAFAVDLIRARLLQIMQ